MPLPLSPLGAHKHLTLLIISCPILYLYGFISPPLQWDIAGTVPPVHLLCNICFVLLCNTVSALFTITSRSKLAIPLQAGNPSSPGSTPPFSGTIFTARNPQFSLSLSLSPPHSNCSFNTHNSPQSICHRPHPCRWVVHSQPLKTLRLFWVNSWQNLVHKSMTESTVLN